MNRLIGPAIAAVIAAVGLLLAVLSGYIPGVFPTFATAHPVRFWSLVIGCAALLVGYAFAQFQVQTNKPATIDLEHAQRNRAAMIAKVRQTWIVGLLDQSIAKDARIALNLQTRPDAVIYPIDLTVQRPNRPAEPVPPGTAISTIYDQCGGALLILGAPGAGKTTLLLELARDLLDHADADVQHAIPVVFPLSTWAAQRRPLAIWLVDELVLRYQVSRTIAQSWLDTDAVLPLLDGMDEVAEQHRNACADAINVYRQTHGHLPLVVCSRIADYEALTTKLQLHGAIVAQPLSRDQVRSYLRAVGVLAIPSSTSPLWKLLDTPLMLTVAALAYAGQPLDALATADPIAARDRLFTAYTDRMFQRNTARPPFTDDQTRHHLAYLAHQMQQHNQTTFYLENLQPDWLPAPQQQHCNILVTITLGLVVGLCCWLGLGLVVGLGSGLIGGLGFGLIGGLVYEWNRTIVPTETVRWSWHKTRSAFVWSWHKTPSAFVENVSSSLLMGLVFGLFFAFNVAMYGELGFGLVVGLLSGLAFGLLRGLVFGLSEQAIEQKTLPNQGIHRSGRNALLVGLGSGLGFGLVVGLLSGLIGGLGIGLGVGLGSGLGVGLLGGLLYGGLAFIAHYVLRFLLIRNSSLPRRLVPFLEYATQRIFLRRIGGGYIFIHRLLLEHFAAQYEQEQTSKPPAIQ